MNEEWNNLRYEIEHQEELKKYYDETVKQFGRSFVTRKIICGGCGKEFYTDVPTKKYCGYKSCFFEAQRKKRLRLRENTVCVTCGKQFTPKRNDAKYCSNACRQKAYRKNVTDEVNPQNEELA